MREYFQCKFNYLETNTNNKNSRALHGGINGFKKVCQLSKDLVKRERGDLVAYCQNISNRRKNHIS
jgi:hypothetical protein